MIHFVFVTLDEVDLALIRISFVVDYSVGLTEKCGMGNASELTAANSKKNLLKSVDHIFAAIGDNAKSSSLTQLELLERRVKQPPDVDRCVTLLHLDELQAECAYAGAVLREDVCCDADERKHHPLKFPISRYC